MPNLRPNEYMHKCENPMCPKKLRGTYHYYIVREYYTEPEKHFCPECIRNKKICGELKEVFDEFLRFRGYEYLTGGKQDVCKADTE